MFTNEDGLNRVYKCSGIPKYPEEFNVDLERPESITDEDIKKWDESFERFWKKMEKYLDNFD